MKSQNSNRKTQNVEDSKTSKYQPINIESFDFAQDKQSNNKVRKYIPSKIESKWQEQWEKDKTYVFDFKKPNPKYYNLVELPYPSGDLHMGHWFTFVPPDVHARFMKMSGKNVFFPNGFDAFGLPAENAAIKRDIHPQDWTMSNIETMMKQFRTMGTMIDWSHKVITCLPDYYRWNQWIFLKMFERGIAYRSKTLSNWCPVDQTVLANEHVEAGKCWRCGTEVVQKEVEQWFLKITEYADRLLWPEDGGHVDWPKSVMEGQNNWIGKSEGAVINFSVDDLDCHIKVFTTRPDTLYGATCVILAPEHELVKQILKSEDRGQRSEIKKYIDEASKKSELERKEMKEKTGVFTGVYAINPVNKEKIPVWVADYVLTGYGTGAIMAVPAHDERDFEFAQKFDLPIKFVIKPLTDKKEDRDKPYVGPGILINSGGWDGWEMPQNISKVVSWLQEKGFGEKQVEYHLHDWSVSRQRYWGTPVPIIHCEDCGLVPVPEDQLPVTLPYDVDYQPKGKAPLATNEEWMNVTCPKCGKNARRDPETLDTFFDSSWYWFRYIDPKFDKGPFNTDLARKLTPVDIYFGGAEHTLGHTLYARFFTKFFHDIGLVDYEEFALKRIQHGIVLGPDGNKMSKSKGNVINPDQVAKEYGADTVRMYLCFMMPYEATAPWDPGAISGVYRFLRRVWELREKVIVSPTDAGPADSSFPPVLAHVRSTARVSGTLPESSPALKLSEEDLAIMHKTIKKVGEDCADIKFNTAVAALMEWLNHLSRKDVVSAQEYRTFVLLLAPFAPHIAEELWQSIRGQKADLSSDIGHLSSVHSQPWPEFDEKYLAGSSVTVVVQVNGRVRDNLVIESSKLTDVQYVEDQARKSAKVAIYLSAGEVKKVIYVPGKILNFVV